MRKPTPRRGAAGVFALALLATGTVGLAAATPAAATGRHTDCLDQSAPLSVEENRLSFTLPDNANPAVLQPKPYAQQMIEGAGFQDFGPALVDRLCRTTSLGAATKLVEQRGEQLWQAAVRRAQHRGPVKGNLPYSDDRPLYWTRLQSTAALRQWTPRFRLSTAERTALITTFDRASRGMFDIDFPAGKSVLRVIISGFDPYTLDGGTAGTAPGSVGNNIRHGNPSGATALSLDGTTYRTESGKIAYVQAYTLPVNYPEFERGYLEDTVGPFMKPGPRRVDASITVSQAGGAVFNLEQWNGRYHGVSLGNDNYRGCPAVNGVPQLPGDNHACNSVVVPRWGGPTEFSLTNPPQWTTATLPVAQMIAANTGADVPRPPGDTWPDPSVAFGVVWHTNYTEFPDCGSTERVTRNNPPPTEFPPPTAPIPPDPGSCSYSGGGGNYLSNESAYRNTLLRDRMGLDIPAGHIHTPDMQHFETDFNPSDATFDAWRKAIVAQGQNLIHAVADTLD
ncbi:hypothetical protein AB0J86_12115 [Micromonospora sp. NPDC049559]|uniref:hypothetical protein n=1 Tax=Micromonospora sp. NPDC049559 TaxID=3155923 RepID=UPI0034276FCC